MTASRPATASSEKPLTLAVVGAGPVGLALALLAARSLPQAQVSVFDARPLDKDVSGDPRTLALSLGSVQLLQRLEAWQADAAQPITEVHVSQQPPSLGAVLSYGASSRRCSGRGSRPASASRGACSAASASRCRA